MSDELCWMTATDLARAIARKKVSPVEVVDAVLARIEKLSTLNAYVTLDAAGARNTAKAAERALTARSAKLGPLHGVPFSVKDLVITQITGRRFEDVTVLRASAALEAVRPWADRRPAIG